MARYTHRPSGKVTWTLDALPALPHDPDTERRVACGFYNDDGREMTSDVSDRGTAGKLRLAADGTQAGSDNTSESDPKSLDVTPDRSTLTPVGSESVGPHRPGLEPGTFGSVDRCSIQLSQRCEGSPEPDFRASSILAARTWFVNGASRSEGST